jgi:DNA-binding NarL/FixJ family response regulator
MSNTNKTHAAINVAVIESDALRFVGFRALLSAEADFNLTSLSLSEPDLLQNANIDVVLLGNRSDQSLTDATTSLKAIRSDIRIIVTGSGTSEETILRALACGAKGYVDEAAPSSEFVQAIRVVHQGLVWAPRGVLSTFIERVGNGSLKTYTKTSKDFTEREMQVLNMLVAGKSNKEIGSPLGIEERTVKAHIAKLMRKVGVQNRIMLSVHAVTHSLVLAR